MTNPSETIDLCETRLVRQERLIRCGFISRATLHRLKKRGLKSHKVGRMVFIDLDELKEFIKQSP